MNSQNITNAVKTVVQNNRVKIGNMINTIRGGWEVWLQVETALTLQANLMPGSTAQREFAYPGVAPVQRCDIMLTPRLGTNIYMEMKVQNAPLDDIVTRLLTDVTKIRNLPEALRSHNMMIATAYMETFAPNDLKNIPLHGNVTVNSFSVCQYNGANWVITTANPVSGYPTIAVFDDFTPPAMN